MRTTTFLTILFCTPLFADILDKPPVKWSFWQPITEAERQLKGPVVDPDAGVEALFWQVWVSDEQITGEVRRVLYHYVRLKVFNEEGKKKIATIDIEYRQDTYITSVGGRTVKADGTILELSKDAVHDRDIVRAGKIKLKARSFAMPGVEAGSIVEYRWKEIRDWRSMRYLRANFQREYPIQQVTYFVKPLPREYSVSMRLRAFNCQVPPLKKENDDFESLTIQKLPAFQEEPLMPAEENVRSWALVYYTNEAANQDPDKYWVKEGKRVYKELKEAARAGGDIKEAARKAVAGAANSDEKTVRLIRYMRANVRNLYDNGVSMADRAKVISQMPKGRLRTAGEIVKSGLGTSDEMNRVFAALAQEVDLDARPALTASRDDVLFDKRLTDTYFLSNVNMAVRDGDHWKFYDVSAPLLQAGKLTWQAEAMTSLITDPKQPEFITVPATQAEDSLTSRTATLLLDASGALDGNIEETWTGHSAYDRRDRFAEDSDAQQQDRIKEEVLRTYPQAEVTAIQVENVKNPEQPMRVRYHLHLPAYAQRTGKRLLFQPFFFERGVPPRFTAAERKYDIHFHYGWREQDRVTVKLPPGFQLEKAETPAPLDFGPLGSYKLTLSTRGDELIALRDVVFGRDGRLVFAKSAYSVLKQAFDEMHGRDNQILSLRQTAAPAGTGQ
jgi:Domain of Unknown Function with PDB structure (DUF3857)